MTTKIKWRLKEQPTSESLRELVATGLLTKEEAREILFSLEDDQARDKESLQEEIKFLRELVQKLSSDRAQIVKTIEYVQVPYKKYDWYQPYQVYCSSTGNGLITASGAGGASGGGASYLTTSGTSGTNTIASYTYSNSVDDKFTGISTF